jgi:hypothetical protein
MKPLIPHLWSSIVPHAPPANRRDVGAQSAESAETRELVAALEAIPAALRTLPWRKERLWPAIWACLQRRPAVSPSRRWATWVSLASLCVIFSGAWWGSALNASPLATLDTRYGAPPPATVPWRLTPLLAEGAQRAQPQPTPQSGKTLMPLPAPAQTPIFSGAVLTSTVAPGG